MSNNPSFLIHYASPYYDPVKAHEYYMENRELKGNSGKSRGTLNEKGQAAKKYVKQQIDAERQQKLEAESASSKAQLESSKIQKESDMNTAKQERETKMNQHMEQMANQIKLLQRSMLSLKGLPEEERLRKSQTFKNQIAKMREANDKKRAEIDSEYSSKANGIQNTYSSTTSSIRENSKNQKSSIRTEAKQKYEAELDKIYSDSSFLKPKKGTRKK